MPCTVYFHVISFWGVYYRLYFTVFLRKVISFKSTPHPFGCFAAHNVVTVNEPFLLTSSLNIAHKLALSLSVELLNLSVIHLIWFSLSSGCNQSSFVVFDVEKAIGSRRCPSSCAFCWGKQKKCSEYSDLRTWAPHDASCYFFSFLDLFVSLFHIY